MMDNIFVQDFLALIKSLNPAVIQIFLSICMIYGGIVLLQKGCKYIFWILLVVGAYLLGRGIITFAMIQSWISQIPTFIEKIFLLVS